MEREQFLWGDLWRKQIDGIGTVIRPTTDEERAAHYNKNILIARPIRALEIETEACIKPDIDPATISIRVLESDETEVEGSAVVNLKRFGKRISNTRWRVPFRMGCGLINITAVAEGSLGLQLNLLN